MDTEWQSRGELRRGSAAYVGTATNLHVLSFNSSCLDLQSNCVYLQEHLQVRRSCTNKLFLLSEQGAQWLQGKQKERERQLSYSDIERIQQKGQTDTHAPPPPHHHQQCVCPSHLTHDSWLKCAVTLKHPLLMFLMWSAEIRIR